MSERKSVGKKKTRKKSRPIFIFFILVIFFVGIYLLYKNLIPQKEKNKVNKLAATVGISRVIPWTERAKTAVGQLVKNSGPAIAKKIQKITHPTGKNASLINHGAESSSDAVKVLFYVDYEGFLFGNHYQMLIEWIFTKNKSISVNILEDSSPIPVIGLLKKKLENYFSTTLYGDVLLYIK